MRKSKVVEMENGRKFRMEFTEDWGIIWTIVYEVYREKRHFFDFSYEKEIGKKWASDDPIELGYLIINDFLLCEKVRKEMHRKIDDFCKE